MKMTLRNLTYLIMLSIVFMLALFVMQAAAKNRSNPPVIREPQWDSLETRDLAARACFDCHSNQTNWPLYSSLPIVAGLIEKHVNDGRKKLNFSEWATGRKQESGKEAAEKVFKPMHYAEDDSIPQPPYSWTHPKARLSQAEKERLASGLIASLGTQANEGYPNKNSIKAANSENVQDDD